MISPCVYAPHAVNRRCVQMIDLHKHRLAYEIEFICTYYRFMMNDVTMHLSYAEPGMCVCVPIGA